MAVLAESAKPVEKGDQLPTHTMQFEPYGTTCQAGCSIMIMIIRHMNTECGLHCTVQLANWPARFDFSEVNFRLQCRLVMYVYHPYTLWHFINSQTNN